MRTPSNIITNESPLIKKKPKAKMKLSQIFYNIKVLRINFTIFFFSYFNGLYQIFKNAVE